MHCRVPLHECRTPKLQVILDLKVELTPNICGNGSEKLQNSTSFWIGVAIALQAQCTAKGQKWLVVAVVAAAVAGGRPLCLKLSVEYA